MLHLFERPLILYRRVKTSSSKITDADYAMKKYEFLLQREMRVKANNGGVQQNQLIIPNYPNHREAKCQTHPAKSVYTDVSSNN